jgi:hypothetical protein|tara:strand:+ start:398 stop:619 length:222 start_codon:yes stop_codon:yes gene_type:complete
MAQYKVIVALKSYAQAEKDKALMALELLTESGVGIGDHTAEDFFKDAKESINRLTDADDMLKTIETYYGKNER